MPSRLRARSAPALRYGIALCLRGCERLRPRRDGHAWAASHLDLPEWVSSMPLFRSPFALIVARNNPAVAAAGLNYGDSVPLDLFCELRHAIRSIDGSMRGWTDEALAKVGRKRRVVLALPHFQAVAASVARGGLTAVLP